MNFDKAALQKDVQYKASRSGGKGGQHVNKVSTKVELLFSIQNSVLFSTEEKALLLQKLQNRLNKDRLVQVMSDESRSQLLNKEQALEKLCVLLHQALQKAKPRKPTKVSKAAKARRLDDKRQQSVKKQLRRERY